MKRFLIEAQRYVAGGHYQPATYLVIAEHESDARIAVWKTGSAPPFVVTVLNPGDKAPPYAQKLTATT